MSQSSHDLSKYLKCKKEDAQMRIIRFPDDINRAPALGYLETKTENGEEKRLFIKNRDDDATYMQVACSRFGAYLSNAIGVRNIVAPAEGIERPSLDDLEKDSAGETMWVLMEDTWKKVMEERKASHEESDDDSSGTDCSAYAFNPSEYDCWHLEEALLYASDLGKTEHDEPDDASAPPPDVEASLRRKLRKAAMASPMKCLDICKVQFITEYSQQLVNEDSDWEEYQEHDYAVLQDSADALTKDETHLLMHSKLTSPTIQAAFLFTAIVGLEDLTNSNIAVIENEDEAGGWTLDVGLFDCDALSAKLGANLKDATRVKSGWGWEEDNGYAYPFLFYLPVADIPLDQDLAARLLNLDLDELEREALRAFKPAEVDDLAPILRERAKLLQDAVRDGPPSQTIRDICYKTIFAWERDWEDSKTSWSHKWTRSILDWASNANTGSFPVQ